MFTINGREGNYNHIYIYNADGKILYQTERPIDLKFGIDADVRNARKLNLTKGDCFEITTPSHSWGFMRNGKDLYIPTSMIEIVKVEEKIAFQSSGETNYKKYYTLRLADGTEDVAESDYYTRCEKTEERLYREDIAKIISSCLYGNKSVSHYEVEELLKKLDISIK